MEGNFQTCAQAGRLPGIRAVILVEGRNPHLLSAGNSVHEDSEPTEMSRQGEDSVHKGRRLGTGHQLRWAM